MTFSLVNNEKKIKNLDFESDESYDSDSGKLPKGNGRYSNYESYIGYPIPQSLQTLSQNEQAKISKKFLESYAAMCDYKELVESWTSLGTKLSTPHRTIKRLSTFYTAKAPHELIPLFYRLGLEAKKQNKTIILKSLPDDVPIPSPLPWDRSMCSDTMFASLTRSGIGNFLNTGSNILSSYYMLGESLPSRCQTGSSFYPKWLSSQWLDGTLRQSMKNQTAQSDLKSNEKNFNEIRLSDVGSLTSDDLNPVMLSDNHSSPRNQVSLSVPKAKGILHWLAHPKEHQKMRCNSTDFAFSEANEPARIVMSTATTPKTIKEYLKPEEKEEKGNLVESILIRIMKNHLRCGRRGRVISQSMFKKNMKRNEEQKRRLARVLWKPSMTSETQRQAAMQDGQKRVSNTCTSSIK